MIAGFAMTRRGMYQFGVLLPPGPRGHVDCGLGKAIPIGPPDLIAPTEEITRSGEELVVDGVRIVFQLTPETEAPSEMNFFFPDRGWLCMAENCSHNMHNLVPVRGAQVRDSLKWSKYIDEADALVRRVDLRDVHVAPLATLGRRGRARVPADAARHVPLYPRPDDASRQPWVDRDRDRRDRGAPGGVPQRGSHDRLLRAPRAQREGGLPALPELVRRQSGEPVEAPAVCGGGALRRARRRPGGAARACPRLLRRRRLPVGGRAREPSRVRRPRQRLGAGTAGRCARAAGVSERVGDVPQRLPLRRPRAALRASAAARRNEAQPARAR